MISNDFEVGRRHDLPRQSNILTTEASIKLKDNDDFMEGAGEPSGSDRARINELEGLDRFAARQRIVEMMEEGGFLAHIEPHRHMVPHGDRGGVPIEPI